MLRLTLVLVALFSTLLISTVEGKHLRLHKRNYAYKPKACPAVKTTQAYAEPTPMPYGSPRDPKYPTGYPVPSGPKYSGPYGYGNSSAPTYAPSGSATPSLPSEVPSSVPSASEIPSSVPSASETPSSVSSAPSSSATAPPPTIVTVKPVDWELQAGQPADCNKWYKVREGDTCATVTTLFNLPKPFFLSMNPSIGGENCANMWLNYYVCISRTSSASSSAGPSSVSSSAPSSVSTGNGPVQPTVTVKPADTETQGGQPANCNGWHKVSAGDTCAVVVDMFALQLTDFVAWNPNIGGEVCANMWLGYYVCVSTAQTVVPPEPRQFASVPECNDWEFVDAGEVCDVIAANRGATVADLVAWNTGLSSDCTNLWAGYYLCTGVN